MGKTGRKCGNNKKEVVVRLGLNLGVSGNETYWVQVMIGV